MARQITNDRHCHVLPGISLPRTQMGFNKLNLGVNGPRVGAQYKHNTVSLVSNTRAIFNIYVYYCMGVVAILQGRINFSSLILRLLSCKFATQILHLHDYVRCWNNISMSSVLCAVPPIKIGGRKLTVLHHSPVGTGLLCLFFHLLCYAAVLKFLTYYAQYYAQE